MRWFLKCLRQYTDFSTRATRTEYWMYILVRIIITSFLGGLGFLYTLFDMPFLAYLFYVLVMIVGLVLLIPSLAVCIRRLHDTGHSGWCWFLSLIPLVGGLIVLYYLVQPSDGDNEYGNIDQDPIEEVLD